MPEETNTVETNEPSLDQFNESQPNNQPSQPAATEPAPAASQPQDAGAQNAGQATQQAQPTQPAQPAQPADPYAGILESVQMPKGVKADAQLYDGLLAVAKKNNLSADVVKELLQLDVNNTAAQQMAEDKLLADAQARWAAENQAKYGDNLKNVETNCSRVLAELDKDGKFKELLATAGVSGHPATLGFLKTIGDLYLEKASVNPNATVSADEEVELENFN